MSAKETAEKPIAKVDEVAQQLKETELSDRLSQDTVENTGKSKKNKKKKKKENEDISKAQENVNGDGLCQTQHTNKPESSALADGFEEQNNDAEASEEGKKKRKRNRNKKKKPDHPSDPEGKSASVGEVQQTDPPSLPVSQLFPDGNFPVGQIMDHYIAQDDRKAVDRFSTEEARAIDRAQIDMYNEIRQAAEAHRQTRQHIQKWVKPGMKMIDICNELESTARKLINENGLKVKQI